MRQPKTLFELLSIQGRLLDFLVDEGLNRVEQSVLLGMTVQSVNSMLTIKHIEDTLRNPNVEKDVSKIH